MYDMKEINNLRKKVIELISLLTVKWFQVL